MVCAIGASMVFILPVGQWQGKKAGLGRSWENGAGEGHRKGTGMGK